MMALLTLQIPLLLGEAYLHAIDPVIVPITESFAVRWYGLSYAVGFLIAWLLFRWFASSGRSPLTPQAASDLMFYAIIGVMAGGRIGYAVFYQPALLYSFTGDLPFWDLLAINKGGMASHGGMIGVGVALWLFARRYNVSAWHVADLGAIAATPGLFLGRLANFINAELWGRAYPDQASAPWWTIKYPQELHDWSVERWATLRELVVHVHVSPREWDHALARIAMDPESPPREAILLVRHTIRDLITAVHRGDTVIIEAVRPLLTAHYPSQIFQAISDGPVLLAALLLVWYKPRKPGVVSSMFLMTYGVLRIITEQFRQPDAALILGISRGQFLSVLLVLVGAALMVWCVRQPAAPMGGLRKITTPDAPSAAGK